MLPSQHLHEASPAANRREFGCTAGIMLQCKANRLSQHPPLAHKLLQLAAAVYEGVPCCEGFPAQAGVTGGEGALQQLHQQSTAWEIDQH
jgi:hypothetical protein